MKSKLKDITRMIDIYGSLLTETKYNYLVKYYFDDLSLHEIAEQYNISRAAVHSSILGAVQELEEYESKLNFLKNQDKRLQLYKQINDKSLCDKLLKLELKENN